MDRRAERRDEPTSVRPSHALALLYVATFLAFVLGKDAPWQPAALEALGITDAAGLLARPWTLLTHLAVHRDPVEGVMAVALLLLTGPPLEDRIGPRRLLIVYLGSGALVALAHVALVALGAAWGPLFTGSLGASAGLLTAYLLVLGGERPVGNVPFPIAYVTIVGLLFGLTAFLGLTSDAERQRALEVARVEAYQGESLSAAERVDRLWSATRARATRPDHPVHVLGLAAGGVALFGLAAARRWRERWRMRREIDGLEEEVEARARVEALLEKISRDGLGSLSRGERGFLRYASRFYRSGRLPMA